jgi:hypothetical protein
MIRATQEKSATANRITVTFSAGAMQWLEQQAEDNQISGSEALRRVVDQTRGFAMGTGMTGMGGTRLRHALEERFEGESEIRSRLESELRSRLETAYQQWHKQCEQQVNEYAEALRAWSASPQESVRKELEAEITAVKQTQPSPRRNRGLRHLYPTNRRPTD